MFSGGPGVKVVSSTTEKIRVLLACSTPGDRELLRSLIELAGDLQVVGETGEVWEARQKVSILRPDVVVVDAGLSGEEAFICSACT